MEQRPLSRNQGDQSGGYKPPLPPKPNVKDNVQTNYTPMDSTKSHNDDAAQKVVRQDDPYRGTSEIFRKTMRYIAGEPGVTAASQAPPQPPPTPRRKPDLGEQLRKAPYWHRDKLLDQCLTNCEWFAEADDEIKRLKGLLIKLDEEKATLHTRLTSQEKIVREAQDSAFALMASTVSKAEDDDVVRSKIRRVRAEWKSFAKDWALKDIRDVADKHIDLYKLLCKNLVAADEVQAADGLYEPKYQARVPSMLLNAELARFIATEIVSRPFGAAYGLGANLDAAVEVSSMIMEDLGLLYEHFKYEGAAAAAHLWRSQTVALLTPDDNSPSSKPNAHQAAWSRRERYYRELVTKFECSGARLLYRKLNEQAQLERRTRLVEIFQLTGELFAALWAQKVYISVVDLKDLVKRPFINGGELLEAHAVHKLEDGDTELDGMPVQMVVEPAILAWGNEKGEAYGTSKIWAKAVVWMSSGAREEQSEANVVGSEARRSMIE